ncbi:MAG: kelch repeat-containing protein [Byssovorax sp.]
MLTWRAQHRATLLADGRVLVTGSDSDLDSAEVYNPASNTWSPAGHMGVMRYGHCSVRLPSGKVLVLGGITPSFHPNAALAELYDPATNTWSSAGFTTGMKRSCDAVLLNDGRALVVGGSPPGAWMPAGDGLPQTIEIYSPSTNTWSPAAPMLKPRVGGTVTKLANGKVLVVGGIDAAPFWPDEIIALSDAELYDPQSDTWSAAGAMHAPSADHTATLLGNGHVLVITDAWQRSQPAEQYDPQSNTWSPAGSLLHSRAALFSFGPSHAAVSLAGGAALVTGGFGDQVWGFLSDAALVDPGCAVNVAFQMSHEPGACPVSGAPFCNAFCGGLGCGVKYDLPVCESQPAWGSPPVTELSYTEYCGCSSTSPIPPPPPPHACPPPRQSVGPERAGLACPGGGDPGRQSSAQDCSVYCLTFGSGGAGCQAHDKATCSSDPALGAHHWTDSVLCVGCRSGS